MMILQWHSDPGESLPGKDVAERIVFLSRSGVTATAVCSVADKFADARTGLCCAAVSDPQAQTGGPVRRGKWLTWIQIGSHQRVRRQLRRPTGHHQDVLLCRNGSFGRPILMG